MSLVAFEDFAPGETRRFGDYAFTAPEIIAFASFYDPQPFHLDEEAGRNSILGGLTASGWHTCSVLMRMNIDGWLAQTTCLAGIGIEENRWLAPVRPGDRLSAETVTLEKIDLRSRPDAGIVKFATTLRNQAGGEVMAQKSAILFARREQRAPDAPLPTASPKPPAPLVPERIDDPAAAMPTHYARVRVGAYAELGETLFTAPFIQGYARDYDPFPFHLDEEAGRAHLLGAMSAAGFQTAACWMHHFVAFRSRVSDGEVASRASPGFSGLLWRQPVLVGDRIAFTTQVVSKRATSKPNLGLITSRNCGVNQRGEIALEFYASVFLPIEE
ncbi:MaoC/PaaZ C-terminal domain-containing protein [uncultured Rhodoblastus sp.]|uniref:MaoC/PaaZ C-terminal domain-containing protein n=1 Tax=uncultured Rhodoblastus sp. TaxID=543037 RepID=UPI0025FEFBA8|nr:MaoC/PaaZ C-terminal domain-containing protein [uncultured Rhodoblastus sp.]